MKNKKGVILRTQVFEENALEYFCNSPSTIYALHMKATWMQNDKIRLQNHFEVINLSKSWYVRLKASRAKASNRSKSRLRDRDSTGMLICSDMLDIASSGYNTQRGWIRICLKILMKVNEILHDMTQMFSCSPSDKNSAAWSFAQKCQNLMMLFLWADLKGKK